jgi:lysophospholipase L1-like esterase
MKKLFYILFLFVSIGCVKPELSAQTGILGIMVEQTANRDIVGFGNSIMAGVAVPSADSIWMNRLAADLSDITVTNYGQNGAGVEYGSKKMNEVVPVWNNKIVLLALGLNDLQISGTLAKNRVKMQECTRHMIVSSFLQTFVPANDPSITITNETSIVEITDGTYIKPRSMYVSGGAMICAFGPATVSYDFTGTQIGCFFSFQDYGYNTSTIAIYIDDELQETVDLNHTAGGASYTNNGGDMPAMRYYSGLSNEAHNISIVCSGTDIRTFFDGFFTLQSPSTAPPVIVGSPCYMMQERYDDLLTNTSITLNNTIIDTAGKAVLFAIADEWIARGYSIYKVDQNLYYTPNITNTDDDYIHPNNRGHGLVFDAWWEVIDPLY